MDPRNDLDDIYDDPEGRAFRVGHARRWQFLGKDPITGTTRWHHPDGFDEIRYPDGAVDRISD